MYVPSNSPNYVCYQRRNKIPVTDLEAVFQEQLKNFFFFSPQEIAAYLDEVDKTIREKQEFIQTLETEEQNLRQEMEKIYRAYVSDELSVRAFGNRYRPLEERFKQLEDEIPRLQSESDFLKIQYLSSDQILTEA